MRVTNRCPTYRNSLWPLTSTYHTYLMTKLYVTKILALLKTRISVRNIYLFQRIFIKTQLKINFDFHIKIWSRNSSVGIVTKATGWTTEVQFPAGVGNISASLWCQHCMRIQLAFGLITVHACMHACIHTYIHTYIHTSGRLWSPPTLLSNG
jgi:hypothetical protein